MSSLIRFVNTIAGAKKVQFYIDNIPSETLSYGQTSCYIPIGAGQYQIAVQVNPSKCSVFCPTNILVLCIQRGAAYTVFATGDINDLEEFPITLVSTVDNLCRDSENRPTVQFLNLSSTAPNVNLQINGVIAFTDVAFFTGGPLPSPIPVSVGSTIFTLTTTTGTPIIPNVTTNLSSRKAYTVILVGTANSLTDPLRLLFVPSQTVKCCPQIGNNCQLVRVH